MADARVLAPESFNKKRLGLIAKIRGNIVPPTSGVSFVYPQDEAHRGPWIEITEFIGTHDLKDACLVCWHAIKWRYYNKAARDMAARPKLRSRTRRTRMSKLSHKPLFKLLSRASHLKQKAKRPRTPRININRLTQRFPIYKTCVNCLSLLVNCLLKNGSAFCAASLSLAPAENATIAISVTSTLIS